jgi:Concanavalin A-like lectin/glucanases superfamily
MRTWLCVAVLVLGLVPWLAWADLVCDGIDDKADTSLAFSTFASASTGTLVLWYQPTGTANSQGAACFEGERIYVIYSAGSGDLGLYRNANLSGNDRLCASNFTGTEQLVSAAYTVNTWTHLAWVHGGGNLSLYKDGTLMGTVASGNTGNVSTFLKLCQGGEDTLLPGEGRIAEAKVYPVALSAAQIAAEGKSFVHNVIAAAPSGLWLLNTCPIGTSGNAFSFRDISGNQRPMVGDDGGNNTGLTCQGSSLSYQWGVW